MKGQDVSSCWGEKDKKLQGVRGGRLADHMSLSQLTADVPLHKGNVSKKLTVHTVADRIKIYSIVYYVRGNSVASSPITFSSF